MARMARIVIPNIPHHVTQRGNRKLEVFFQDQDFEEYLALLKQYVTPYRVSIWAYCLMTNHVHIIATPQDTEGLSGLFREVHCRYTRMINFRNDWRGHLWQVRYSSYPMDESHLLAAARYIERNPVTAGLCQKPEEWPWTSARHHLGLLTDPVISRDDLLSDLVTDWDSFLSKDVEEEDEKQIRTHQVTGRPLGDENFMNKCEDLIGRILKPAKRGPKGPWKHKSDSAKQ